MAAVALSLICLTLGYGTVALLYGSRPISWALMSGLSILLGTGECSLLLFYLALMNLRPGWGALAVAAAAALILVALAAYYGRCRLPAGSDLLRSSWWERALLLIPLTQAAYALAMTAVEALRMPLVQTDSWAFWLFKAKIITAERLNPPPLLFTAPTYAYTHVHYPLLWPMLAAAANGSITGWNDHAARLILIPLYAGLGLMIYAALRARIGRFAAAMLASIQLALPGVLYYAGRGLADVILAGYYAAMLACILLHAEQNDWPTLIAAALLATACAFTKIEGAPLAAIGAVALFLFSAPRWRTALTRSLLFTVIVLVLLAPWYGWSHAFPRLDEDYQSHLSLTTLRANFDRLAPVLAAFGREFMSWNDWGPFWIMLPIFAAIGYRGITYRNVRILWLALLGQFVVYVVAYVIAPADLSWLLPTSIDRLVAQLTPPAILLIGLHLQSIREYTPLRRSQPRLNDSPG